MHHRTYTITHLRHLRAVHTAPPSRRLPPVTIDSALDRLIEAARNGEDCPPLHVVLAPVPYLIDADY